MTVLTVDVITYSCMVAKETVHMALTMAALHDLNIKAADALNAYMMVHNNNMIWTIICPEFGEKGVHLPLS